MDFPKPRLCLAGAVRDRFPCTVPVDAIVGKVAKAMAGDDMVHTAAGKLEAGR